MRKFLKSPRVVLGLSIVILFILTSIFAPIIAPKDPLYIDITNKLAPASLEFPLGSDQLGRCIFSRLLWGGRTSLLYSFTVLAITILIGVPIGLLSGYLGGVVDTIIMRVIDLFIAIPHFLVALAITGTFGASGKNLVISMSLVWWAYYTRMARGLTVQVKEMPFIMALKASGIKPTRIIFMHIIRNIAPSLISIATIQLGTIILTIAGFSFIGLGVQPPTPEWGIMLSDAKNFIQTAPQLMMYPGISIVLVVMAFNFIGEGIEDEFSEK